MKGNLILVGAGVVGIALAGAVAAHDHDHRVRVATTLRAIEEVPAISSTASGFFKATIDTDNQTIAYELSYEGIDGVPLQAHIHLGQTAVNGSVSVFLCATITAPAETPTCPVGPATVTGTLTAAAVIGPAAQGISPGEFDELVNAIRRGVTYVNVHSTRFPGGEIRGQLDSSLKR